MSLTSDWQYSLMLHNTTFRFTVGAFAWQLILSFCIPIFITLYRVFSRILRSCRVFSRTKNSGLARVGFCFWWWTHLKRKEKIPQIAQNGQNMGSFTVFFIKSARKKGSTQRFFIVSNLYVSNGEDGGIRTHVPFQTTWFRVKLVITTSIHLHTIKYYIFES